MLEKIFKLSRNNTNVKTEIIGGLTTFITMSYIIFVNPVILSASGMNQDSVFLATYNFSMYRNIKHFLFP